MADERFIRSVRSIEASGAPRSAFVEDLHAQLAEELGLRGGLGRVPRTRPRARRRIGGAWIAAAMVVALAGLAIIGFGTLRPPSIVVPTTSGSPAPTPTASPTATATATPRSPVSPTASAPPPSLDALRDDGQVVYQNFDLPHAGFTRLEVLADDLSGHELVPGVPGNHGRASWSRDGSRLAFSALDPSDLANVEAIWEVDAAGASPRRITTDCARPACVGESDPAYSSDGTRLAFVRSGGSPVTTVVAIRDLATGRVAELESTRTVAAQASNNRPRWSPDGSRIAYDTTTWADGFAVGSTISLIAPDGTGRTQLTEAGLQAGDPDWSPDGSLILFSTQPIHSYIAELSGSAKLALMHVYVISPDGSGLRQLEPVGGSGAASWSPDGSQILFSQTDSARGLGAFNTLVMDADGADTRILVRSFTCCSYYPVQQPTP